MPHTALKLIPGVDQNRTPTLNEAAVSTSQLIRFMTDKRGASLVQKLGGWTKFFPSTIGSIVRALWAWEDTNAVTYLGVGSASDSSAGNALSVIANGGRQVLTPRTTTQDVAVSVTSVANTNTFTITAMGSNVFSSDSVYIKTQISIGGVVLFGMYRCVYVSANSFQVNAHDILGNPALATSSVTGGATPSFIFTSGSSDVTVTLANHNLVAGDTFPVLIPTSGGGVTLSGNYTVSSVTSSSQFVITANASATSTPGAPVFMNGGNAEYVYFRTPTALPSGTGYGVGGYGVGGYGVGTSAPTGTGGTPISASDWTLDNWGQVFVACPVGGNLYQWNPTSGVSVASVITNAPVINDGMFVAMPQRQIVAWGSTFTGVQDPLLVRWSDVDDYTTWTASIANQVGSYRIPRGSKVVGGIQGPQQGLLWTDLACWAMQYIGAPDVYGFNEIGTGCGLIARKAAASMNGVVYWMGQSQFFMMGNGSGVQPIPCSVWDVVFQELDTANLSKIRAAPNSRFNEISWYYPTLSSRGEVAAYVKYNTQLQTWDFGALGRTAWINESVLGPPIGADPTTTYIYQHETSTDADGAAMNSSFTTGYFVMDEGEFLTFVDQVWPDMKWGYYGGAQTANVLLTFNVLNYPGDTPRTYGPFTLMQSTQFITPRFRGRLVSVTIQSNDIGSFWRLGNIRYRAAPDGKF